MRTYDFSPLARSVIGFDRLSQFLDTAAKVDGSAAGYPPYNIERVAEDRYHLTMAVAGFGEGDLEVTQAENTLTVRGKLSNGQDNTTYLHRGIARRPFERRFQLADYIKVTGASLSNGLLHVDLVREVPDAMKPRTIAINAGEPVQIEKAAA